MTIYTEFEAVLKATHWVAFSSSYKTLKEQDEIRDSCVLIGDYIKRDVSHPFKARNNLEFVNLGETK